MRLIALIAVTTLTLGCLRSPEECATDDDCFVGEVCAESSCQPGLLTSLDPPPPGPMNVDEEDWLLGGLTLAVTGTGVPHVLVEELGDGRLHHIFWNGAAWANDVVLDTPLSDFPGLHVVPTFENGLSAMYLARQTNELHILTYANGSWTDEVAVSPRMGLIPYGADLAVNSFDEPVICYSLVDVATLDTTEKAPIYAATKVGGDWIEVDTGARGLPGCGISVSSLEVVRVFGSAYQTPDALVPTLFTVELDYRLATPVHVELTVEGEILNAGATGDNLGAPVIALSRFGLVDELVLTTLTQDGWTTRRVEQLPEGQFLYETKVHTHPDAPGLFEVTAESYSESGASTHTHYALWGARRQEEVVDADGELDVDWFDLGVDVNGLRHPVLYTLNAGFVYLGPQ